VRTDRLLDRDRVFSSIKDILQNNGGFRTRILLGSKDHLFENVPRIIIIRYVPKTSIADQYNPKKNQPKKQ
jgi:hypothetical protein